MEYSGGCLCRAVRYTATEPPLVTRVCWCRTCQYIGAGSGTVNACFRTATFRIVGLLADLRGIADSGNVMHRRFCPECGTHLFSEAEVRPHLIFVRAGTLDDPERVKPDMTIWTSSAPSWACIDPGIPSLGKQPPPAA